MGISKGIPAPSSGPTATSSKNYLPELLVRFIESEGVICWDWNLVKTVPIVPSFTGILIYIYLHTFVFSPNRHAILKTKTPKRFA
jgi:hypothetical protein